MTHWEPCRVLVPGGAGFLGSSVVRKLTARGCGAKALLLAAERYDKPDPVNVGTGIETSIRDLVDKITRVCGYGGNIRWNHSKPDGQPRRCLDVSRAEKECGFRAAGSLDDGLRQTIEWYREQVG